MDSAAQGKAVLELTTDSLGLRYRLDVQGIRNVTAVRIVLTQAKGKGGLPVVWLLPSAPPAVLIDGRVDGVLAAGAISKGSLVGPLADKPLSALIEAMRSGKTYINVCTQSHPNGEIRGAIKVPTIPPTLE